MNSIGSSVSHSRSFLSRTSAAWLSSLPNLDLVSTQNRNLALCEVVLAPLSISKIIAGLGYDFSGDNIFQLGDANLTVSGLLLSAGSAIVAFSLKNLVSLIRQPSHLLLINSSIAAIETKSAQREMQQDVEASV